MATKRIKVVYVRNSDDWEPNPWKKGFLRKIKDKTWSKWSNFVINYPNLAKLWNKLFRRIFGFAYYHYRKCYYLAFDN